MSNLLHLLRVSIFMNFEPLIENADCVKIDDFFGCVKHRSNLTLVYGQKHLATF